MGSNTGPSFESTTPYQLLERFFVQSNIPVAVAVGKDGEDGETLFQHFPFQTQSRQSSL